METLRADTPYRIEEKAGTITFCIPSQAFYIDRLIQAARSWFRRHCITETARIEVVLRELLTNALRHGNREEARRPVSCQIGMREREAAAPAHPKHPGPECRFIEISVIDTGSGFDHTRIRTRLPENPGHTRQRGYRLITALSSQVEFNGPGNCVTVWLPVEPSRAFSSAAGATVFPPVGHCLPPADSGDIHL
jgi:anti-sigma regulatory factor (Ser/Thr protein kinase)